MCCRNICLFSASAFHAAISSARRWKGLNIKIKPDHNKDLNIPAINITTNCLEYYGTKIQFLLSKNQFGPQKNGGSVY